MKPAFLIIFSFLSLTILLPGCSKEEPRMPYEFEVEEAVPPIRIGLSDGAESLEPILNEIYSTGPDKPAPQFIVSNERALGAWLDAGELDAVIVYQPPDTNDQHWSEQVALDGLAIVSHPDVELEDLGLQALKTLFTGTVDNWSIFGLKNQPVVLYSRELGAGSRAIFDLLVLADATISPNTLIATSVTDMYAQLTSTHGAIGYMMMGSLNNQIPLAINGAVPSRISVSDGSYPLATPIYVVSIEQPSSNLKNFISDLLSERGQNLIGEKYGQVR